MDITPLLSYLRSTSHLALSCKGFAWRVRSNGFPIRTSKGDLCPENLSFYKLLDYPNLNIWTVNKFFNAVVNDDCDYLLSLLQGGANIEAKDYLRTTALIRAAGSGKRKPLKLLLQHGANLEAKDVDGWTALICAAKSGHLECLKLLLQHKANIEAKDYSGDAALNWADVYGETECLQLLLEYGAQVSPQIREKYPEYSHLWVNFAL